MRFPKPWYRPNRGVWYVTIEGTQHNLGPDREKAIERYHALLAKPRPKKVAADSVLGVIDAFLDWCQKHRAPDTYEWYHSRLQLFVKTIPPELTTDMLRPLHVQQWIDSYDGLAMAPRPRKRNTPRASSPGSTISAWSSSAAGNLPHRRRPLLEQPASQHAAPQKQR